jgi:hypothetical protein
MFGKQNKPTTKYKNEINVAPEIINGAVGSQI